MQPRHHQTKVKIKISSAQMFAKRKKMVDENFVSDECNQQVFKAGTNLQPSTSKFPSQE